MKKIKKWMKVCPECGFIGKGKMQGTIFIEIVLWLMFILPGLLYTLWRYTQIRSICPKCGCKNMIPVTAPKGKILVEQYNAPDKATD